MFQGQLLGIFVTAHPRELLNAVDQAEAVVGKGLQGDRYFSNEGTFSKPGSADREVTLIESEALEGLAREYNVALEPAAARRNLVTRQVPLNHLVGREFVVGSVVLRGIRLCEPCGHLEKLTIQGVKDGLRHRGGLRAQIIQGGILRQGDLISPHNPPNNGENS
jgi:MOSC domain-containing protein YiiM